MESDGRLVSTPSSKDSSSTQESTRLPVLHYCIDVAVILTVWFGLEWGARYVGPHESGFFCDDKSIRFPYASSTVTLAMLLVYCIGLNLIVVVCVETYLVIWKPARMHTKFEQHRCRLERIGIRAAIFYGYYFAFELLVNVMTTYTKYPVGRLRPHFLDVCRPTIHLADGTDRNLTTDCTGLENIFLTNYTCMSEDAGLIKEARLSFFSGHSSLAMGASTYAILYLQYRLAGQLNCKLVVPALQVIIGGVGLFIAYSRIFDYKHHWTDVIVGIFVGILVMLLMCRFVAGFFVRRHLQLVVPVISTVESIPPRPKLDRNVSDPATTSTTLSTKRSFEWTEPYA